jgi:uncharacterized protein (DUF433 family)
VVVHAFRDAPGVIDATRPDLVKCIEKVEERSFLEVPMTAAIVNNRIDGLRVTVYDVLYYLEAGRSHAEIAEILPLTLEQIEAAVRYIDEHRDELMANHRRIEDRLERGNPPDVEERARVGRARMETLRRSKSANGKETIREGTARRRE